MMRIGLLHFDLCGGPMEKNREKLLQGIRMAADRGADWVLTPEMALQGYHMAYRDSPYRLVEADEANGILLPFQQAAKECGIVLFLACGMKIGESPRNSCIVIGRDGEIMGRHDKIKVIRGASESWADAGDMEENLRPLMIDEIRTGLLVCADAYFDEYAVVLKERGAELVIVVAAWPPKGCGGPPENAWRRCSMASGVPVLLANQTGNSGMDCREAQSAMVDGERLVAVYEGPEAVLVYPYDRERKGDLATAFEVYPMAEKAP